MRYLTKEVYKNRELYGIFSKCSLHKETGKTNEETYEKLYKEQEKAYVDFKIMFLGNYIVDGSDYEYWKTCFYRMQLYLMDKIVEYYPKSIVEKVEDIRVLVLGYCDRHVLKEVQDFNNLMCKKIRKADETYYKFRAERNLPCHIDDNFNFLDCHIENIGKKEEVIINFEGHFDEKSTIIFHNPKIMKDDEIGQGATFLHEEIYKIEAGYEVHILFKQLRGDAYQLCDFIVECKDMSFPG